MPLLCLTYRTVLMPVNDDNALNCNAVIILPALMRCSNLTTHKCRSYCCCQHYRYLPLLQHASHSLLLLIPPTFLPSIERDIRWCHSTAGHQADTATFWAIYRFSLFTQIFSLSLSLSSLPLPPTLSLFVYNSSLIFRKSY